jgi:hypothetical protein
VRNDHCLARGWAFEYVVRTGDTNKCPTLALEAANDVAAVGQHHAPSLKGEADTDEAALFF